MKNLLKPLLILSAFLFIWTSVQSQDLPRPSQHQKITQRVGLTDVTIEYSRPNAKGRVIYGDLVPYDKVWRTGANAATVIEINSLITVQGQSLAPGRYAIFTMPKKDGDWQIMINSEWEQWGTREYKSEFDAVSVNAPSTTVKEFTETFTIGFDNVIGDNAILYLVWANTRVNIGIEANSSAQANENIKNKLDELEGVFSTYNSIARYYLDNDGDPADALMNAQKSVEIQEEFWNVTTLSVAYAANNDYKMAIETAELSLAMSKEAGNKSYEKQNESNLTKWREMK